MPNPLAALFLPKRRLAAAEPRLLQRGGPLGGTQWVAPRAEIQYRRHDFGAIPQRQRVQAAELHARRLLPSAGAAVRIGWLDAIAHFWVWEKPLVAAVKGRGRWIPEPALRRPMVANGVHLLECEVGVEGQVWQDGALMASQWWPAAPTLDAWQRFLRGAGVAVEEVRSVPGIERRPLQTYSWAVMQHQRDNRLGNTEFMIWTGTLMTLAAAAGWQAASLDGWMKVRERQEQELTELRRHSAPIQQAHEDAEAAVDELRRFSTLQNGLSDYAMVADIISPLPPGSQLMAYQRDVGSLKVLIRTSQQDLRKLVALYQRHPVLAQASATPSGEFVEMVFDLPKPPPQDDAGDSRTTTGKQGGSGQS